MRSLVDESLSDVLEVPLHGLARGFFQPHKQIASEAHETEKKSRLPIWAISDILKYPLLREVSAVGVVGSPCGHHIDCSVDVVVLLHSTESVTYWVPGGVVQAGLGSVNPPRSRRRGGFGLDAAWFMIGIRGHFKPTLWRERSHQRGRPRVVNNHLEQPVIKESVYRLVAKFVLAVRTVNCESHNRSLA